MRRRSAVFFLWALRLHAAWVALVLLHPQAASWIRVADVAVLSIRADFDMALVGIYGAWLLANVLRGRRPGLSVLGVLAIWVMLFQLSSRAGLLAALLTSLFVLWAAHSDGRIPRASRNLLVATLPVGAAVAMMLLPSTDLGQRMAGTFASEALTVEASGAMGTTGARERAWAMVLGYAVSDPARLAFGVGFGPDFLAESRASQALLGEGAQQTTRSPHNYWLGSLARLGILGLGLLLLPIAIGLSHAARVRVAVLRDPLLLLAALAALATAVTATVGVVLEAPFGAVSFWWSLGVLLAHRSCSRANADCGVFSEGAGPHVGRRSDSGWKAQSQLRQ